MHNVIVDYSQTVSVSGRKNLFKISSKAKGNKTKLAFYDAKISDAIGTDPGTSPGTVPKSPSAKILGPWTFKRFDGTCYKLLLL